MLWDHLILLDPSLQAVVAAIPADDCRDKQATTVKTCCGKTASSVPYAIPAVNADLVRWRDAPDFAAPDALQRCDDSHLEHFSTA